MREEAPFEVRMFGAMELRVHGEPMPALRTRKGLWLLAILLLKHGTEVPRDRLAVLLWPDSDESLALGNLRRILTELRGTLGPEASRLQSPSPRSLRFDVRGADIDLIRYDQAIARGDLASLETAVEAYRGPLLEGCAEEWVLGERTAREQSYLQALETLAESAIAQGRSTQALPTLRRLIQADPLRESAHRSLMQALADDGDYAAMILTYRELRLLLRQEVNAEPAAETTRLFGALRESLKSRLHSDRPRPTPPPTAVEQQAGPDDGDARDTATSSARPAPPFGSNVPHILTPLIGREVELEEVTVCLKMARCVTLTGTGGVGKTRLAIQVAQDWSEREEVLFVELAAVTAATPLTQVLAQALGLKGEAQVPLEVTVQHALAARRCLLVLDNCEHVIEACIGLCQMLLRGCENLRILITSRTVLGIPGEVSYPVPPLDTPEIPTSERPSGQRDAEQENDIVLALMEYPVIRLFVQRAQGASSSFRFTPRNAPVIARICRQLDGIPLAIELAAARTKALSAEQILERLSDRFRLLSGGTRPFLAHHQTLRELIDWSYDLLSDPEKRLLARLSVFVGGWTLDAAESVCAALSSEKDEGERMKDEKGAASSFIPHPSSFILHPLSSLVEKSLVQVDSQAAEPRYRLLETIRQYAAERLEDVGECEITRARHAGYYLAQVESLSQDMQGEQQNEALNRLEQEHDNLRAAIQWSLRAGEDPQIALRFCKSMGKFWIFRGYYGEGRAWCKKALEPSEARERTAARAATLSANGTLSWIQGDLEEGQRSHEEALSIRRELGDPSGIATSLERLAMISVQRRHYEVARPLLEEAVRLARETDDLRILATGLINLGCVAKEQKDNAVARDVWEEARAASKRSGDRSTYALSLNNLAATAQEEGDYEQAWALRSESLELFRATGDRGGVTAALHGLGLIARAKGDYGEARSLGVSALTDWREWGNKEMMILAVETLASLVILEAAADPDEKGRAYRLAARLLGGAEAVREAFGCPIPVGYRTDYDTTCARLKAALDAPVLEAAWQEGSRLSLDQIVAKTLEFATTT